MSMSREMVYVRTVLPYVRAYTYSVVNKNEVYEGVSLKKLAGWASG